MDVLNTIKERRSIRKFTDTPITSNDINIILEAARWAPNAGNSNSWRFIVVSSPKLVHTMQNFTPGIFNKPAAIIVVCIEPTQKRIKEATRLIHMADAAIVSQNISLVAYSMGIGSCIVASFAAIAIRALLDIPEHITPYLAISLGYPDESPIPPPRLSISDTAFLDNYGSKWQS